MRYRTEGTHLLGQEGCGGCRAFLGLPVMADSSQNCATERLLLFWLLELSNYPGPIIIKVVDLKDAGRLSH